MKATQNVKRKVYIPAYDSAMAWKRPQAEERVNIDFDALHETLCEKMQLNAIMETKSIELAASFRTNS